MLVHQKTSDEEQVHLEEALWVAMIKGLEPQLKVEPNFFVVLFH
jgi:hypothetical protein